MGLDEAVYILLQVVFIYVMQIIADVDIHGQFQWSDPTAFLVTFVILMFRNYSLRNNKADEVLSKLGKQPNVQNAHTHVVYVPGLGTDYVEPPNARWHRWLWDDNNTMQRLPVTVVTPHAAGVASSDLGSPTYVTAVVNIVTKLASEGHSILLVGQSRGAGVVTRALMELIQQPQPPSLLRAICLMGPFDTTDHVLEHRYGRRIAKLVAWYARRYQPPVHVRASTLAKDAGKRWPILFVTSNGDTNIPPSAVEAAAQAFGGKLLILGPKVPHSLIDADGTSDFMRIREEFFNMMRSL